jgi:hypothetical protein
MEYLSKKSPEQQGEKFFRFCGILEFATAWTYEGSRLSASTPCMTK